MNDDWRPRPSHGVLGFAADGPAEPLLDLSVPRSPSASRRGRDAYRRRLVLALAAVAVVLAGGAGYAVLRGSGHQGAAAAGANPAPAVPAPADPAAPVPGPGDRVRPRADPVATSRPRVTAARAAHSTATGRGVLPAVHPAGRATKAKPAACPRTARWAAVAPR